MMEVKKTIGTKIKDCFVRTYLMGSAQALFFVLFALTPADAQEGLTGTWAGQLEVGPNKIDLIFHVVEEGNTFKTRMDIPAQGVKDAAASSTLVEDKRIHFAFGQFNIEYEGNLESEGLILGEYRQGGITLPLNLTRDVPTVLRPQEPLPPFPYHSEEIQFSSTDGTLLAGTLSSPKTDGVAAFVIIISGSGPQDRDGSMFGHKPYLVLGDHLNRAGIGVLRFDERGMGQSEGVAGMTDLSTQIQDVQAALTYLKNRSDLRPTNLGLIGHSIGGLVAPQVAGLDAAVDFLVLLAAPGLPGDELMLSQKADYERKLGIPEFQISQGQALIQGAYNLITQSNLNGDALRDSLDQFYIQRYGTMLPESQRNMVVNQLSSSPEVVDLIRSQPAQHLEKIQIPVLALNGDKDFQVLSAENLPAIEAALKKAGNPHVHTVELKGLNHLFQESQTGLLDEYAQIEQTFSPQALNLITTWILERISQ